MNVSKINKGYDGNNNYNEPSNGYPMSQNIGFGHNYHHDRDGYIKNGFSDDMNNKKRTISYDKSNNNINNIFYG